MHFYRLSLAILPSFLLLVSCGGGGGGNPGGSVGTDAELTGVFVDSTVQGIGFSTASRSGTTNAAGEFTYLNGEQVTFSIGGIILGQVNGASLVTPVTLVAGAIDETNEVVTNIAQLLQTLDDDGNPDNGISIPDSVTTAALDDTVDTTSPTFDTDIVGIIAELTTLTSSGQRALVSETAAQSHLKTNLHLQISGNYSGTYAGSFTNGDITEPWSGTWELIIDDQGNVSGRATDQEGSTETFFGEINSSGTGVTGGSDTGASFSLTINSAGIVSGSWSATDTDDPSFSGSGTLTGSKSVTPNNSSTGGNLISEGEVTATGETSWPPSNVGQILDQHFTDGVATPFTTPSIDTEGEQDWWSFSGEGNNFFFFVKTGADHQANDLTDMACVANIFDENGNMKFSINPIQFLSADDGYHKNCEVIFTPPDNSTYYLRVRASDAYMVKTGSYSLYVTRDEHTQNATATNQSRSYSFNDKILNRHYESSRVFTLPDVSYISSFIGITSCQILSSSTPINCPSFGYIDETTGDYVLKGSIGNYRMDLNAFPVFRDVNTNALTGITNLYDWSIVPMFNITITNPNPLPNYNPDYPYCVEATKQSFCATDNIGNPLLFGGSVIFHAYSSGWSESDAIPSSLTCADLGYSSDLSIFDSGSPGNTEPVGTCQFKPNY